MGFGFERVFFLKCHTPLIHFQPDQAGATLRATEVKPKLDRFLCRRVETIPAQWRVGQTQALNYKLRFAAEGKQERCPLGYRTDYDIFYGNMGNGHKKEGVKGDVKMTVICTIPALMTAIEENIRAFFLVTNFGTMQGKGFGSYTVEGPQLSKSEIGQELAREYGAKACYFFDYRDNPFPQIKKLYARMKSGTNFREHFPSVLFRYAGSLGLGNEKAWMKREKIAPAIGRKEVAGDESGRQGKDRYVRALLGVGQGYSFLLDPKGDRRQKEEIKVACVKGGIDRCPSSIFFKPVGGTVYCVARKIPEELYGAEFSFQNTARAGARRGAGGVLSVPTKEELGGEGFADRFLAFCAQQPDDPKRNNFKMIRQVRW